MSVRRDTCFMVSRFKGGLEGQLENLGGGIVGLLEKGGDKIVKMKSGTA